MYLLGNYPDSKSYPRVLPNVSVTLLDHSNHQRKHSEQKWQHLLPSFLISTDSAQFRTSSVSGVFSCEDAALQVLMSSICLLSSWNLPFSRFLKLGLPKVRSVCSSRGLLKSLHSVPEAWLKLAHSSISVSWVSPLQSPDLSPGPWDARGQINPCLGREVNLPVHHKVWALNIFLRIKPIYKCYSIHCELLEVYESNVFVFRYIYIIVRRFLSHYICVNSKMDHFIQVSVIVFLGDNITEKQRSSAMISHFIKTKSISLSQYTAAIYLFPA